MPPVLRTTAPRIPDHEVLRCVGKGSYGEVWLARSVTGALRAVKVVHRADFELERTFEREFEGIMKYEPVSRDHPGLVHVLHVGRNDEEGFYYYVMELGDDRETGTQIDPAEYEARTLGTDRTLKRRLTPEQCVQFGIQLADGLAHLHGHGLTHRDIKPSNIIFVNGNAKLADIGLVATEGQMTFVGTEGFVPPEGPGSASADMYSLGMVLYELSTGMDRLQFPELPSEMGDEKQRPLFLALNEVVCKACAPAIKKRYLSAHHMAGALRLAWEHRKGRTPWVKRLLIMPFITGAAAFGIVTWRHGGVMPWPPGQNDGFIPHGGSVMVRSDPSGATVFYDGETYGPTPCTIKNVALGTASFVLKKQRYKDLTFEVAHVLPGATLESPLQKMAFFDPPQPALPWTNSLQMPFESRSVEHISKRAVQYHDFKAIISDVMFQNVVKETTPDDGVISLVEVQFRDAERFCDKLAARELGTGYLTPNHCYTPEEYNLAREVPPPVLGQEVDHQLLCFRLLVQKVGGITIESEPPGANILASNGVSIGVTPFVLPLQRPGSKKFTLRLSGYENADVSGTLPAGGQLPLNKMLERSRIPVARQPWANSLEMKFEPIGDVLFSRWETRIRDYGPFAKEMKRPPPITDADRDGNSDIGETALHPAVFVTRADAIAFCEWLTIRERQQKWLNTNWTYRLPTDEEWSTAADYRGDSLLPDPASRHNRARNIYPWTASTTYPPPGTTSKTAVANLGDLSALEQNTLGELPLAIKMELRRNHYFDGHSRTAPVGTYRTGPYGLCDMSGNVWELVGTDYGGPSAQAKWAVTRGAAWSTPVTENREQMFTQFRRPLPPEKEADASTGFRIVVGPVGAAGPGNR